MRLVMAVAMGALVGMLVGLVASWVSIPTTVAPGSPDRCCTVLVFVPPLFGFAAGGVAAYYRQLYRGEAEAGRRAVRSHMRWRRWR